MLDGTAPDNAFAATYFNNANLTSPVLARADPLINFDWGASSPAPGVEPSTFAVRWTGTIQPKYSETYTFITTADDGVRLTVDGQTLIDRWTDRPSLPGDANNDGVVDFIDYQMLENQTGSTGPECDFNHDGKVDIADFSILYPNLGKTLEASTPVDVGTITLQAGQTYDLKLEYYQDANQAQSQLEWQSDSQPRELVPPSSVPVITDPTGGGGGGGDDGTGDPTDPGDPGNPGGSGGYVIGTGNGLLGTYFDNMDLTGATVTRIDPLVSFRWSGYRPTSRIDATTFSVRWEGQVQAPSTGDYTFFVNSDDGARLWVDGKSILDVWGDKTESEYPSDPIHLEAGQRYDIKFEYYQNQGEAVVGLKWGGPVSYQIIPTGFLFPADGPGLPPSDNPPSPPPATRATGALRVSDDGHVIQRTDGSQFFWLADTAWSLFNDITRPDADYYLQDRARKEFTVTQAVLYNPDASSHNAYGQSVFLNNNPATPNPAYFDNVDYVLDKAQSLGLYVAVLPTWGDAVAATDGRRVFNSANAYTYGQWLGSRYANQPNIIWVLGGDWAASTSDVQAVWRSLAAGLQAGDGGTHLITYHPPGGHSSDDYFGSSESWLDFNTIQSGHTRDSANYTLIAGDYADGKPTIDSEPNYENIPNGGDINAVHLDDYDVRKKTYWALFAGAFGAAYGSWEVYGFSNDTSFGREPWKQALNYPGAGEMKYAKRLMLSRPYLGRVPDQSLVVGSTLSGSDHIQATRGGDGSYAFVYSASGQSFTVDLSKLSGSSLKAYWYDPRDGSSGDAGTYSNTGTQTFMPPTSGYGNDWVLVIDDASKNYAMPGLVPPPVGNPDPRTGGSVTGSVTDGVKTIPYRLFEPSGVGAGQRLPLILYLHGMGERGTDNVLQTTWMGGIVNHTQSGQYAAYVLAPQIDPSMWFQSYNGSPTEAMSLTIKALDQVIATHDIDTTRIYVTGVSMGAMGAWDILRWAPGRFAAAVPLSGYANPNTASAIKNVPIWAFHGSNDTIVPVSGSRNMIAALRAAGGNPKYTEIAGGGHVIWNPIYNDPSNTLYSWLFSQQLGAASASVPDAEPVSATKPKPVFSAKPVKVVKPKTPPTRKPATGLFSIAPTTRRSVARG
ncbi:MAG TPA: DUF4038 domain-containing protein [Tepidisphaeraceae bacterium]